MGREFHLVERNNTGIYAVFRDERNPASFIPFIPCIPVSVYKKNF